MSSEGDDSVAKTVYADPAVAEWIEAMSEVHDRSESWIINNVLDNVRQGAWPDFDVDAEPEADV